MSLLTPVPQQSIVTMYKGVAWSGSYDNIRLFSSASERESYLTPLVIGRWSNLSICKPGRSIKVEANIGNAILGNYLKIENEGVGSTWVWYAFVTAINYVNVNTIEIEYEVDWIQSYLFDIQIGECFVEREHVSDDTMGKHTVDEHLDTGEMVIGKQTLWTEEPAVIAQVLGQADSVENVDGVVTATTSVIYYMGALGVLGDTLTMFNDSPERVALLTMGTTSMGASLTTPSKFTKEVDFVRIPFAFSFNGETYVPKNNKLGCYPFMFFTVDNFGGQVEQFHYEDFDAESAGNVYQFYIEGMPVPKPTLECVPRNYKNIGGVQQNAVRYDNFPEVPWINDTYKAWVSQNQTAQIVSMGANLLVNAIGFASNPTAMGALNSVSSLIQQGYQMYQDDYTHKLHSSQMQGTIGGSGLNFARGYIGFRVTEFMMKPEFAKKIDMEWLRYGYRVDTPKVPNIKGRKYCNYVKCRNVEVSGNIPTDAKSTMENALLSGTTFWHTNDINMELSENPII